MKEDRLKKVRAGLDAPSASQQNLIVDILKENAKGYQDRRIRPRDDVRIFGEDLEPYKVYQISEIYDSNRGRLLYLVDGVEPNNTDNFDVIIASGVEGWGNFAYDQPALVEISGTAPAIGAQVGPKTGEDTLLPNFPGFRYLGDTELDNIGWVIRDRGIATGQGEVITSSGQVGTPAYFELENVAFSSGFDGWDHVTDLEVLNVFSDEACAGQIVQFKWDIAQGEYISTDVECC
jgi:hypothetical protein